MTSGRRRRGSEATSYPYSISVIPFLLILRGIVAEIQEPVEFGIPSHLMERGAIIPYGCIHLDTRCGDMAAAIANCLSPHQMNFQDQIMKLQDIFQNESNTNPVLACLSVRSALDLYFSSQCYPAGSEVVVSALNIPDIAKILHHHGLVVVAWDIDLDTTAPNAEDLPGLLTERTVAVVVAHLFGKHFNVTPYLSVLDPRGIHLIEDCAESFAGFEWLGDPRSEVVCFSFGTIKNFTAFGGSLVKVRSAQIFQKMYSLQRTYKLQSRFAYLKKLVKYTAALPFLDSPAIQKLCKEMFRVCNYDHHEYVVKAVRGFPDNLLENIRQQPSAPLLATMHRRLSNLTHSEIGRTKQKGDYVTQRLPHGVKHVGSEADFVSYWLYPILVNSPDKVSKTLNYLGVDAYRGASQLGVILSDQRHAQPPTNCLQFSSQVVYMPVNKLVPYRQLDKMLEALNISIGAHVKLKAKL